MQALILSAGTSSRLGVLTKDFHKCLLDIKSGLKIVDNQLRALRRSNISEIVMVVGYQSDILIDYVTTNYSDLKFSFISNKQFANTNCLYSLWLSREYLNDDLIYMTGDLVMDINLIAEMRKCESDIIFARDMENENNRDFCARVIDGFVKEVSINVNGKDVFPCLPLMKLSSASVHLWINEANKMVKSGLVNEYEMAALNKILDQVRLYPYFSDMFCMEVDEKEDLITLRAESTKQNLS